MSKDKASEKTKVMSREDIRSAADPDKDRTRVYDALTKETRAVSGHKWIDDDDEPMIRPVGRNTLTGRETQIYPGPDSRETQTYQRLDRKTRVGRDSNTRLVERQPSAKAEPAAGPEPKRSFRETVILGAAKLRQLYADIRNVRVGDSRKFARFMKILGAFALILLLEIGYFRFSARVEGMPDEIKETRKELELTQKENEILSSEIEALGDQDSTEELRQSWERLRDKVEKAAEETLY